MGNHIDIRTSRQGWMNRVNIHHKRCNDYEGGEGVRNDFDVCMDEYFMRMN